ncbi:hypothetical protein L6452_38674 [Arctium lappa]|uniref:Uncharacterized protein n=1 Tax=Arctium lappa TaxID=4217 RepID=A0ACB8XQS1_ARCLA|nr:hypothetical protein L6452_38674 [Arctium lappa]
MDHVIINSDLQNFEENFRENQKNGNAPIVFPQNSSGSIDRSVQQTVCEVDKNLKKDILFNSIGSNSNPFMTRSLKKNVPRRRINMIEAQIAAMDVNSVVELSCVIDLTNRRGNLKFNNSGSDELIVDEDPMNREVDVQAMKVNRSDQHDEMFLDDTTNSKSANSNSVNSNSVNLNSADLKSDLPGELNFEVYNNPSFNYGAQVLNYAGMEQLPSKTVRSGIFSPPVSKSNVNLNADFGVKINHVASEPVEDECIAIVGNYMMNSEKYIKEVIQKLDSRAGSIPKPHKNVIFVPVFVHVHNSVHDQSKAGNSSTPMVENANFSNRFGHIQDNNVNFDQNLSFDDDFGPGNKYGNGFFSSGRGGSVAGRGRGIGSRGNGEGNSGRFVYSSANYDPVDTNSISDKTFPDVVMEESVDNRGYLPKVESIKQPVNVWSNKGTTLVDKIKGKSDSKIVLNFKPPVVLNDRRIAIRFSKEVIIEGAKANSIMLVAHFVGASMPYFLVNNNLNRMWKMCGLINVASNYEGHYMLKFNNGEGLNYVLEN